MNINIGQEIIFSNKYYNLIKSNYEKIILDLLNNSKLVFKGKFKYNEKQDNGECDYISNFGEHLDAKILFDEIICKEIDNIKHQIKSNKSNSQQQCKQITYYNLINKIFDYVNVNLVLERDSRFRNTVLYKEMKKRISKLKDDENGVLVFPFPIISSIHLNFGLSTIFSAIYSSIVDDNEDIKKHIIYLITMEMSGSAILENLNNGEVENISNLKLNEYIKAKEFYTIEN